MSPLWLALPYRLNGAEAKENNGCETSCPCHHGSRQGLKGVADIRDHVACEERRECGQQRAEPGNFDRDAQDGKIGRAGCKADNQENSETPKISGPKICDIYAGHWPAAYKGPSNEAIEFFKNSDLCAKIERNLVPKGPKSVNRGFS